MKYSTSLLNEIKKLYPSTASYEPRTYRRSMIGTRLWQREIPIEIAQSIMRENHKYPRIISALAERTCRLYISRNLKPVGEVSNNEHWFTAS